MIDNRDVTSFGVSIGLGLMLETIFSPNSKRIDEDRIPPSKVDVNTYEVHYINLGSIIKSIHGSLDRSIKNDVMENTKNYKYMAEAVLDELAIVDELYEDTKCTPQLYHVDYKQYMKPTPITPDLPDGKLEMMAFIKAVSKLVVSSDSLTMGIWDKHKIGKSKNKVLFTTSFGADLLNVKDNKKLDLLELHTGELKAINKFNTKYHSFGKNDLSNLPWDEKLLYILGDKMVIQPLPIATRRKLVSIANKSNWNFLTTRDKIIFDLKREDFETYSLYINTKSIF